jgi:hypothetical protein
VRRKPARPFIFKAPLQLLHRGRVREQIERLQQALKIPCIDEDDCRLAVFLNDDGLLGIAHCLFRQLGGAIVQICRGYSFHGMFLKSS